MLPNVFVHGEGGSDSLTVIGQSGIDDAFEAGPGRIFSSSSGQVTNFVNVSGIVAVDGVSDGGGGDSLTVFGRNAADVRDSETNN